MKTTYFTTDYDSFSLYPFNRETIDGNKIAALMEEMQKNGYDEFQPLIVSVSLKVADGQHRLEAAKRLGIGVWVDKYDREFTPDEVRRMNLHRTNWTRIDFLHSMLENEAVQRLHAFAKLAKKEGIPFTSGIKMAMAANRRDQFRNIDKGLSENELEQAKLLLQEINVLSAWIPCAKKASFLGAYIRAKRAKNFNFDTFVKKVQQMRFDGRGVTFELVEEIERTYNYRTAEKDRINIPREGLTRNRL